MSVFFFCFMGNDSEHSTNKSREALSGSRLIHSFIPPWTQRKRHSFLIFTRPPTKILSKIIREKLSMKNYHSNGHSISFDVLITAHGLPNCRTNLLTVVHPGLTRKCSQWFNKGNIRTLKILTCIFKSSRWYKGSRSHSRFRINYTHTSMSMLTTSDTALYNNLTN